MWEDVRRCEKMWRWEDEEKMGGWEDVKMRRCEDEKMWRWEDVKMRGCEDERMWRWEDVKMRRCEDEKMWRWEDVKMRICFTDPHYWKNPALRRSREYIKYHIYIAYTWLKQIENKCHYCDHTSSHGRCNQPMGIRSHVDHPRAPAWRPILWTEHTQRSKILLTQVTLLACIPGVKWWWLSGAANQKLLPSDTML